MATRSAIAIKHGNVIKAVYCHWDGYLLGVGLTLHESYNHSPKVNKLISMGDISSLQQEIDDTKFFGIEEDPGNGYKVFHNEKDYVEYFAHSEYFYLYDQGVWYFASYRNNKFERLDQGIIMEALTQ